MANVTNALTVREAAKLYGVPISTIKRCCWRVPGLAEKVPNARGPSAWRFEINAERLAETMRAERPFHKPGPRPRPPEPPRTAPAGEACDAEN